ncbi:MAG: Hpt domain-containing protein [Bacteroidales bacterium]|jgi:HPt (histidine-containing phosphotransfer) domain-containing protein
MAEKFTYADLTYLESMSMGSNELIIEMIQIFIDQLPEFTEGLQAHLANKDYAALGALAHKAKSSVAIMGMDALATDLKTLELNAKAGIDIETYPVLVDRFIDQVTLTGSELASFSKSIQPD